jgi:hypothetical protein
LTRFRAFFLISMCALLATALTGCFGSGGGDPKQVVDQATFKGVQQAQLNLSLDATGTSSQGGTVKASLTGPFESQGKTKLPKFDLKVQASGSGPNASSTLSSGVSAGATYTGTEAFVTYGGTTYALPASLTSSINTLYESTAKQQLAAGTSSQQTQARQQLVDQFKGSLTDLKSEGSADVGGTQTDHISGKLDIAKILDAALRASSQASGIAPSLPNASQISSAAQASFDLYVGQSDHIIRKLDLTVKVDLSKIVPGGRALEVHFTIELDNVNKPQQISAPANAQPLPAQLVQRLNQLQGQLKNLGGGGLGGLGALGSLGGAGASGGGTATPSLPSVPSSGAASAKLKKYQACLQNAQDTAALQACASLLQ